ncbi:MAG TPA: histidine kinase [Gemmatimonadaceae bacterium]|nr:histidine kinase [Gemmatimonadaceae bacterium]
MTRTRNFLLCATAFTAVAVLFAVQRYYADSVSGRHAVWTSSLIITLVVWWSWGALTPLIVQIAKALPVTSKPRIKLALQIPVAVGVTILHDMLVAVITPLFFYRPAFAPIRDMFRGRVSSGLAFNTLIYFLILAVVYAIRYAGESQRKEIASAQLAANLARTQLQALQTQLQPHFLFNTLNSILALVPDNPAKASDMIRRLSELLRYSLATSGVSEVLLGEEIQSVRAYLDIQKIRFEDRLDVSFAVADDANNTPVPTFILQPLVENAVKFTLDKSSGVARIRVAAGRRDGMLDLSVEDNGPGISTGSIEAGHGVGLRTTRARLEQLYGINHSIRFDDVPSGGTRVSISIPVSDASTATPA